MGFHAWELCADFSDLEMRLGGFNAVELLDAGFDLEALRDAGFQAWELPDDGSSPKDLRDKGFDAEEVSDADSSFSFDEFDQFSWEDPELQDTCELECPQRADTRLLLSYPRAKKIKQEETKRRLEKLNKKRSVTCSSAMPRSADRSSNS